MKLCIEGDIYFIPKFHILKTGTVKLSIETGLSTPNIWSFGVFNVAERESKSRKTSPTKQGLVCMCAINTNMPGGVEWTASLTDKAHACPPAAAPAAAARRVRRPSRAGHQPPHPHPSSSNRLTARTRRHLCFVPSPAMCTVYGVCTQVDHGETSSPSNPSNVIIPKGKKKRRKPVQMPNQTFKRQK
jgi:hypothetical protein